MVLVSTPCKGKIGIHSQRGPIQSTFHVVRGKGIAGEQPIDVTGFDEASQMVVCAGPYNGRTGHDRDSALGRACAPQLLSQLANDGRFWLVGIDDRIDELKDIGVSG